MYPNGTIRGLTSTLGQDDSSALPDIGSVLSDLSAGTADVSFLSSPLFLGGAGLLVAALLLRRGKKVVRSRRKSSAKRAATRAQIAALRASL